MSHTQESALAELWRRLRQHGLQHLAPMLLAVGVRSISDLVIKSASLLDAGMKHWQLELLLCSPERDQAEGSGLRSDLPRVQPMQRAYLTLALEAAQVNCRKRALQALDADVLARSTRPAVESRVRTYEALCHAWEVAPWPISIPSIRAMSASLKAGHYRSAPLYFQAVVGHQRRALGLALPEHLRAVIRDALRSVLRGIGPAALKDSFDMRVLVSPTAHLRDTSVAFSMDNLDHCTDLCVLASWFMLREIELSGARAFHLYEGDQCINLMLPTHKTDVVGQLTVRSLGCACRVQLHPLCPFHAGRRHLARLRLHAGQRSGRDAPLCPDAGGQTPTKQQVVAMIQRVLAGHGVDLMRTNQDGRGVPRFGGHVLRVSGAQFLAAAGVPRDSIQLLGRWASSAIDRYIQQAPLRAAVPNLPHQVLSGSLLASPSSGPATSTSGPILAGAVSPETNRLSNEVKNLRLGLQEAQSSLSALQAAVRAPSVRLVVRRRATIVHLADPSEHDTEPSQWRTPCGWSYGLASFFRVPSVASRHRQCRKCFHIQSDASDSSEEGSSTSMGGLSSDCSSGS